jgi:hypothetical protein
MHSWSDYAPQRHGELDKHRAPFEKWFPEARLLVKKTSHYYLVVSLAKGGVFKAFDVRGALCSDTGIMAETAEGQVLVSHLVDEHEHHVDLAAGELVVSGFLSERRHQLSSPLKQMAFRALNLTVGRMDADLMRRTLQKVLITGKPRTPARFQRRIRFTEDRVTVLDSIDLSATGYQLVRLSIGSDATSIYVANSNTFQESMLLPWLDLPAEVALLNRNRCHSLPARDITAREAGRGRLNGDDGEPESLEA